MFWLDKTPIASGTGRGEEISAWLAEHAMSRYVTIDDHVDMGSLRSHLIVTHSAQGLQRAAHATCHRDAAAPRSLNPRAETE